MNLAAVGVNVACQPLTQAFDLHRIDAEDERLKFMDRRFHSLGKAEQRAFTNAVKPLIGLNSGKEPILPWIAH
jgi:hypothetical protein